MAGVISCYFISKSTGNWITNVTLRGSPIWSAGIVSQFDPLCHNAGLILFLLLLLVYLKIKESTDTQGFILFRDRVNMEAKGGTEMFLLSSCLLERREHLFPLPGFL